MRLNMHGLSILVLSGLLCVLIGCVPPPQRGWRNGQEFQIAPDGVYEPVIRHVQRRDDPLSSDLASLPVNNVAEDKNINSTECADFWKLTGQCASNVSGISNFNDKRKVYNNCIAKNDAAHLAKICTPS
jgi:hypothetical protein